MRKYAIFILLILPPSLSFGQDNEIKDSIFIKHCILKFSPLTAAEFPKSISFASEIRLSKKTSLNLQLGYSYLDQRIVDWGKYVDYIGENNINLDSKKLNFKSLLEFRYYYSEIKKAGHISARYAGIRFDFTESNYSGQYNICTHLQYGFLNYCDSEKTVKYSLKEDKFRINVILGKEIIYKSHFIFEYYYGFGICLTNTLLPPIEKGLSYDNFLSGLNLDVDPEIKIEKYSISPNPVLGFRIGYSF